MMPQHPELETFDEDSSVAVMDILQKEADLGLDAWVSHPDLAAVCSIGAWYQGIDLGERMFYAGEVRAVNHGGTNRATGGPRNS